jgi:hypothetical protein
MPAMPRSLYLTVFRLLLGPALRVALSCLSATAAYPQARAGLQWITPEAGDVEVLYRYLARAHGEALAVSSATSTSKGAATRLHAQEADLAPLDGAYRSVTARLAEVHSETLAYRGAMAKAGQKPDRTKLEAYYARRVQLLRSANEQLRASVGSERWAKLQAYIDGEFRSHIKVEVLQWTN